MIFASWTFDGYFLDINLNSGIGDVTNYIKNGEWNLIDLIAIKNLKKYSCCEEPYPEIFYKLIIRRRPLYYVFNMVFPCLLITLVAFLGFYLPPGSSEKVSIGITTLLSITVFLMLVAESMPPTSEQLPLLGIYYAVTIGIVSFSTAMAVITLNINNKGSKGRKVPHLVRVIFFNYLAKLVRTGLSSELKHKYVKNVNKHNTHIKKASVVKKKSFSSTYDNEDTDTKPTSMKLKNPNFIPHHHKEYSKARTTNSTADFKPNEAANDSNYFITQNENSLLEVIEDDTSVHSANQKTYIYSLDKNDKFELIDRLVLKSTPIYKHFEACSSANYSKINSNNEYSTIKVKNYCLDEDKHNLNEDIWSQHKLGSRESLALSLPIKKTLNSNYNTSSCNSNNISSSIANKKLFNAKLNEELNNQSASKRNSIKLKNNNNNNNTNNNNNNNNNTNLDFSSFEFIIELDKLLTKQFNPLIECVLKQINKNEKRLEEKQRLELIQSEWSDVAMIFDHLLCYFFCILTLASCLLIFFNSPHVLSPW